MAYFEQLRGCKSTLNGGRLKRQMARNDHLTAVNLPRLENLPKNLEAGRGKNGNDR
jgi:hypothetical protein